MKKVHITRKILPSILAFITGRERYLPNIEWRHDSWTHNAFRAFEAIFWRAYGKNGIGDTLRLEVSAHAWTENGEPRVAYAFHTVEAAIANIEAQIRKALKREWVPIRIHVPILATQPGGFPVFASPYLFAIAYGTVHTVQTSSSYTGPTVTGSDTLGIVYVVGDSAADNISATSWGGGGMTKIGSAVQTPGDRYSSAWWKAAPSSGGTIAFTGGSFWRSIAAYYTGAAQTGQPDASNTGTSSSTTVLSIAITVVASNCWAIMFQKDSAGGQAYTSSNALASTRYSSDAGGIAYGDSNGVVSTGSQTCTLTGSGSAGHGGIAFSIKPASNTYNQSVDATTSVSASMLTPKTIVQTLTGGAGVAASVSIIKDFVRTLDAATTATASVLKEMALTLSAGASVAADMTAQRVFLVAMNALTSATASLTKTVGYARTLTAEVSATASLAKQLTLSVALSASATVAATIDVVREIVLTATVTTAATMTTAIGKTLTATVSIVAKITAPFWRTKYPAHGDGEDYEIKYPHE